MDPIVLVGKAITLTLGVDVFTEQTTSAAVIAEPQTDTITNTVGDTIDIDKGTKFTLKLSAMQDWTQGAAGLFGMLAAAYDSDTLVDFEMVLAKGTATATVTGQVRGRRGDFGGDSSALLSDLELPIVSIDGPTYIDGATADEELADEDLADEDVNA